MSLLDLSRAMPVATAAEFDRWLAEHGAAAQEAIVAIFNKASSKQTVTFDELLEVALSHGWIDTQEKKIDAERYALRFTPRRPQSNWSDRNRAIARRLVAEGRMTAAGSAVLPEDL